MIRNIVNIEYFYEKEIITNRSINHLLVWKQFLFLKSWAYYQLLLQELEVQ